MNTSTSTSLSVKMQHAILDNATVAVKSYVASKYPHIFTKEDVEDIISNTSLKACRSIGRYNSAWAFSTWMGKIAKNCVLDALDDKMKHLPISGAMTLENEDGDEFEVTTYSTYRGDEYEADRDIAMKEFFECADEIADSLSAKDKAFFEMMKEEMTPAEMAKECDCTANAASIRIHNIRKKLEQPLAGLAEEFDIAS